MGRNTEVDLNYTLAEHGRGHAHESRDVSAHVEITCSIELLRGSCYAVMQLVHVIYTTVRVITHLVRQLLYTYKT